MFYYFLFFYNFILWHAAVVKMVDLTKLARLCIYIQSKESFINKIENKSLDTLIEYNQYYLLFIKLN